MPPAVPQSSPNLAIILDQRSALKGGETVSGHVVRKSHFVDPDASVVVRLFGRVKTKLRINKGVRNAEFRNRFDIFDSRHTIYRGALHIPPDGSEQGKWPFAVTLPKQPDLTSLRRDDPNAKTFVSLDTVASQPLPASMYIKHWQHGRLVLLYVEYYVEATLGGSGNSNKGESSQAICPFTVRPVSSPNPLADFALKKHSGGGHRKKVVSQHLVPGMENAKLSFGQKTKKMFGSSQVPAFAFSLELEVPTTLQIGNPSTVPFQVRATPLWDETSEVLRDTPQMIVVQHFALKLQTTTHYTSKRLVSDKLDHKTSLTLREYNKRPVPTPTPTPAPTDSGNAKAREAQADAEPPDMDTLILPISPESPSLNLGWALGIKVGAAAGGKVAGSAADEGIYPTFATCNIKHEHQLVWELRLTIAGETAKFEGQRPVTLMGPSYDQDMRA